MLTNLGRWRPREAAQQTNVKGVEVQTPEYVGPGSVARVSGRC